MSIAKYLKITSISICSFLFLTFCDNSGNVDPIELDGYWASSCYPEQENEYVLEEFDFRNSNFEYRARIYDSNNCSGYPVDSIRGMGRVVQLNSGGSDKGKRYVKADFRVTIDGNTFIVEDIISREGNSLYFGETSTKGRPSDLNLFVAYEKSTSDRPSTLVNNTSTGLKIFVTDETHNHNFRDDPSLLGSNAIEKADSFCQISSARPNDSDYKALLVDGVNRDAIIPADWVLETNTQYFRPYDDVLISQTGANAIFSEFSSNLTTPVCGDLCDNPGGAFLSKFAWTGLDLSFNTTNTCNGWSTGGSGSFGNTQAENMHAFGSLGTISCNDLPVYHLYCVEQPPAP